MTRRLAQERSPYLRHAADQPVDWYPWCDEAFERARREDRPVFLSSGGVWCHWCHVMAKETFFDPEVARTLNEAFVCIKLDRDERPDIDRRYQQAVAVMGGGGGWPLSVFLTPDRRAFYGGTYFPPADRFGRPGFPRVLQAVLRYYHDQRGDAEQQAGRVMGTLGADAPHPGELLPAMLEDAARAMLAQHDAKHGGFGSMPKFPMPGAIIFLLRRAAAGDDDAGIAARRTLEAMARGGFHDHLAGGFHRYSTDQAWTIPHFEKMADDNAWLLRAYVQGFALFGGPLFRDAAAGIIRFARQVLSDPAGGFFASQDADVTPDDEGGYFTWTTAGLQQMLTIDEYEAVSRHLLQERGSMHHDPEKNVLFEERTPEETAAELDLPTERFAELLRQAKDKLLRARNARRAPFVDTTVYTSLNGMFITAFLQAGRILGDVEATSFALVSLERVLRERHADGVVEHAPGVPGFLDDHVFLAEALVEAYESTGDQNRLRTAERLMRTVLDRFGDRSGGLFDTAGEVLGARLRRVEDVPHPSANAVAAEVLLRLHRITGQSGYLEEAERLLGAFAGSVTDYGVHAGAYFSALDAYFNLISLSVEAAPDSDIAQAARAVAGPATVLVYGEHLGRVIACFRNVCAEPATGPDALLRAVAGLLKR